MWIPFSICPFNNTLAPPLSSRSVVMSASLLQAFWFTFPCTYWLVVEDTSTVYCVTHRGCLRLQSTSQEAVDPGTLPWQKSIPSLRTDLILSFVLIQCYRLSSKLELGSSNAFWTIVWDIESCSVLHLFAKIILQLLPTRKQGSS